MCQVAFSPQQQLQFIHLLPQDMVISASQMMNTTEAIIADGAVHPVDFEKMSQKMYLQLLFRIEHPLSARGAWYRHNIAGRLVPAQGVRMNLQAACQGIRTDPGFSAHDETPLLSRYR